MPSPINKKNNAAADVSSRIAPAGIDNNVTARCGRACRPGGVQLNRKGSAMCAEPIQFQFCICLEACESSQLFTPICQAYHHF